MDNFTVGVVVFPGSNCDRDVSWALEGCLDIRTKYLWHESSDLSDVDAIVLPGGFSYGCLLYTSPSPRDRTRSRMPSSA